MLRGTEALTLEVGAALDAQRAREIVPQRFELDIADDVARGSLLLFRMSGLSMNALPFASFDYSEALWRISVRVDDELAWFVVACDLDSALVRFVGARLIRYPTRAARIVGSEARWRIDAGGVSADLRVSDIEPAPVPTLRRVFVGATKKNVYEIPWDEAPPARARLARVTVAEPALVRSTFGDGARLDETGVVHRGRIHMCGFAKRL